MLKEWKKNMGINPKRQANMHFLNAPQQVANKLLTNP